MKKVNEKGFTLAELLIVVAVIAVLVAVAIPTFSDQLEKARQSTDIANLRDAYSVARLAELENKVDGVAIKNTKTNKQDTVTYYFNAGTGKLVAYTNADDASANGTKMKAQTKTLKVDANESVYYSYYNAGTTRTTTGPVDSVMKYLLTVDTAKAILKVTFLETGKDTLDFDLQSVTYVDPALGDLDITNPGDTPGTVAIGNAITITSPNTTAEVATLELPKVDNTAVDVATLAFSKMSGPAWLTFDSTTANKLVTTQDIALGAKVETYPVSIFVIDDDGRTGTYSFNIEVAKDGG